MATNKIQYKSDGVYYNDKKIGPVPFVEISKTANYTITSAECNGFNRFNNNGATGVVILTLPPAQKGLEVCVLNIEDQTLTVLPNSGDLFYSAKYPSGKSVAKSGVRGESITFYCTSDSEWFTKETGKWLDYDGVTLAAPSSLAVSTISNSSTNLSWTNNATNELGIKIERSEDGTNFTEIGGVPAGTTSFTDVGLVDGTVYYYRVRAYNHYEKSQYSNTDNTTTTLIAPSGLTATAASSTQINLSWTDNSAGEDGFKIERSTDGTNYTQIATRGANVTTFSNSSLAHGVLYYYRVRGYSTVNSGYSNVDSAITTLPAPSNLIATGASVSQINLSWTDNSVGETGFKVERSPNGSSSWVQIATRGANVTTYSNTGLTDSTTYYYRVRAYRGTVHSSYTSVVSGATIYQTKGYAMGGGTYNMPVSYIYEYNPATNAWIQKASLSLPFFGRAYSDYNGKGYTLGGRIWYDICEYDPVTNSRASRVAMSTANYTDDIGFTVSSKMYKISFSYNQEVNPANWVLTTRAPLGHQYSVIFYMSDGDDLNNKGYLFQGHRNTTNGALYGYYYVVDTWTLTCNLPYICSEACSARVGSKIYRTGGYFSTTYGGTTYYNYNYEFTPVNTWVAKTVCPGPWWQHATADLGGSNYYMGTTAYQYNPSTNAWSTKASGGYSSTYLGAVGL